MLKPLIHALLTLTACTTIPNTEVPTRANPMPDILPAMQSFPAVQHSTSVSRANVDIARDFLDLTFEMESGKTLEVMTRFEGPISLSLAKPASDQFQSDLSDLLERFRSEARIDIRQSDTGQPANIVIETLPRKTLQASVPQAACFVVPRVKSWSDFRKNRRTGALDWTTLTRRERVTIFIPDDISPQEARDCLHEEIAQSLGPLNDLYRLSDSVFNDDNINTILTSFDMLILRAYYSRDLRNGMTRAEAAKALPSLLSRLNPAGVAATPDGHTKSTREWINHVESALGPRRSQSRRVSDAKKALAIARIQNWNDNRLGFTLMALGRLSLGLDHQVSTDSFARSFALYSHLFGTDDIHTAHVSVQLAAFALSTGNSAAALNLINASLPSVSRAQNASLLATLLMIKAEALDFEGKHSDAATVRLDSLGWARYGFASDDEIRARLSEIAALRPHSKEPGV